MGWMSKTKVPAWLDSGENPLPKFRLRLLILFSHVGGTRELSQASYKGINFIPKGYALLI